MQQQQPTAAQTVDALNQNLSAAFVKKHDAEAVLKQAEIDITAIRNVLAGIQVGKNLVTEAAAPTT